MSHFEQLDPDQRIVLRMAIRRRRSYAAMAEALGTTPEAIRGTALTAAGVLVPERPAGLDDAGRDQVAEYLLGQQDGAEATATARLLSADGPARAWALLLQDRVSGLGEPAAEIPPLRAATATRPARAAKDAAPAGRAARTPEGGAERAPAARAERAPRTPRAPKAPRPARAPRSRGSRGGAPRAALAAVAAAGRRATATRRGRGLSGAAALVVVLVLGLWIGGVFGGGGSDEDSGPSQASEAQALAVQFAAAMPSSIPFRAPAGVPAEFANASGVATPSVSSDDSAVPVLSLVIKGLPAPTTSLRYFVWADRNGRDPVFLGELPAVSGAQLPFQGVDVATRQAVIVDPTVYSRVRVTRETSEAPTAPGPTVLVGTITPKTA